MWALHVHMKLCTTRRLQQQARNHSDATCSKSAALAFGAANPWCRCTGVEVAARCWGACGGDQPPRRAHGLTPAAGLLSGGAGHMHQGCCAVGFGKERATGVSKSLLKDQPGGMHSTKACCQQGIGAKAQCFGAILVPGVATLLSGALSCAQCLLWRAVLWCAVGPSCRAMVRRPCSCCWLRVPTP